FSILILGALCCGQAMAAELIVSAASSLSNAFRELAPLYEAAHPDTKVQLNFAGSGAMLQQISKGDPVDVFASADQATMNQAQERGLITADQRSDFVSNSLVVVVPVSSTATPASLADITGPSYARVAIGLPASVPVGRYTQAVHDKACLWTAI